MSDGELGLWLDATDVCLFNYRRILTSGGTSTARLRGCPLLVRQDLDSVLLDGPNHYVQTFKKVGDHGFLNSVNQLAGLAHEVPEAYKEQCSWSRVATKTSEVYDSILCR